MKTMIGKLEKDQSALLKQLGARVLGEANDLKRTPDALAKEMGLELNFVNGIIAGKQNLEQVRNFIWTMAEIYPISIADLWLDADDTNDGILITRAEDSASSSRIFERPDSTGILSSYYEYRDTAMSRTAPFRPEWIKQLRLVEDSDPANPNVAFNNGHLLHQMTFFIGAVNFYWEIDGEKYCAEMNTGDSCLIMPYVPHSFTKRKQGEIGLVIAVTFGGEVRRSISEIMHIGVDHVEEMAGDLRDDSAYVSRLNSALNSEMLTVKDLSYHLESAGVAGPRASSLALGREKPNHTELKEIAACLNLRPNDLIVPSMNAGDAVTIKMSSETPARAFPSGQNNCHQIKDLARSPLLPNIKGFDIHIGRTKHQNILHGFHEYLFVYGDSPVSMVWGKDKVHQDTLMPGDSAYFRPMIERQFSCESKEGRLLCVRVPSRLNNEVLNEYASFPKGLRKRVAKETMKWF